MSYYLALLLLGPIFWLQGKYVRWVTPTLATPAGARSGVTGQGSELSLFIVGDSAALGLGVEHQDLALAGQISSKLKHGCCVRWRVFAESGDTSSQLLEKLRSLPAEQYQNAVVSIGVNDVTGLTRSRNWQRNIRAIVRVLVERYAVRQVFLCSIPPMHQFPALPNPLRWWLGLRARQLDAMMASIAKQEPGGCYVAVPYSGDCSEIAADGFHPGALAYKIWGAHVAELVRDCATEER